MYLQTLEVQSFTLKTTHLSEEDAPSIFLEYTVCVSDMGVFLTVLIPQLSKHSTRLS